MHLCCTKIDLKKKTGVKLEWKVNIILTSFLSIDKGQCMF